MRRAQRRTWVVLSAIAAGRVWASTGYPAEIQSQLQLNYTPACSICHAGNDTDAGTVTTPFGQTMVEFGLQGGNNLPSLDGALAGLEGSHSPYITYLQEGLDPNNPNAGTVPPPTYGCFTAAGAGPSAALSWLGGLVLVLRVFRRPRRGR